MQVTRPSRIWMRIYASSIMTPIPVKGKGKNMRRVIVRRSSVHGRGVFAARPLAAGERVLQY